MQFDVSICAFDGAEICKSVGLYLLSKLKKKLQVDSIGLFRDDALATLRSCSGCMAVRARKNLIKVVQDCGLKITVLTNFTSVNFLDVNIDLTTSLIYKPLKTRFTSTDFRTTPIYYLEHTACNRKACIDSVLQRGNIQSSSSRLHNLCAQKCWVQRRHNSNPKENSNSQTRRKRNRPRRTMYNPPCSKNVITNVVG